MPNQKRSNPDLKSVVMEFGNNELKPILGRVRKQNKKKKSKQLKKQGVVQVGRRGSNKNVFVDFRKEYDNAICDDMEMEKIAEIKQGILERAKSIIIEDKKFNDRMTDIDKRMLLESLDPVSKVREQILSLPTTISKIYEISNLDVMPRLYERDHIWLSMQWVIDEVENPFMSRPCASNPCLGKYIRTKNGGNVDKPLPEIVPLNTLDTYRDYRSRDLSTKSFKDELTDRRQDTLELTCSYTLGRDICGEPRCVLCVMRDMYCTLTKPSTNETEITLKECQMNLSHNFVGISRDFVIDGSLLKTDFLLKESHVSLPIGDIPLIGSIVNAIYQNENNEIVIDDIYTKKT